MPTELDDLRAQLAAERSAHAAEVGGLRAELEAIGSCQCPCQPVGNCLVLDEGTGEEPRCMSCIARTALATPSTAAVEAVEGMRKALEAQPCRCSLLLKCPHCAGDVVEGVNQFSGSWICGACVKEVNLPKDPAYPCIRCAALAAWEEATRG